MITENGATRGRLADYATKVTVTFGLGRLLFLSKMKADFKGHKHNAYYTNDF